ncbi:MAG: hypothetical protein ABSG25_08650 [Bryobacteraceae bacterium]
MLSFTGALACAVLYLAVIFWNLPPSDGAYGQPFLNDLRDPFVLIVLVPSAGIFGLITTPFAYFLLRGRRLLRCAVFTFVIVALEVILVTPWYGLFGEFGAFFALVAALLFCGSSKLKWFSV